LLWRQEWDPVDAGQPIEDACRLHGVFAAFAAEGVEAEPVVYSDESADRVREQLLALDGVLVWVNPIEQGRDRSTLDPLLRDVAASGVFVSAHPDVILKMGTKKVLVDTRSMSWGSDTRIYRSASELREGLPARVAECGPLVLKQHRGMGGQGVWKVEPSDASFVRVQHASGGLPPERLPLEEFLNRCDEYFGGGGSMVEQPYLARLPDGMIRAYLCRDRVVGFTHQYPRGLMPAGVDARPATKRFEPASAPAHQRLREKLETHLVPEMQTILDLDTTDLPLIWDADFLFGPKDARDEDSFVLCEINVSSTFAFPELAMPIVARAAIERLTAR